MDAQERVAAAISRMEQVRREMAERRALRDRNGKAIRERSLASFKQHGQAIEQRAKQLGEVARRRQAAHGWSTEKIDRETSHVMGFGPEPEVSPAPSYQPPPPVTPPRRENPGGVGPVAREAPAERRRRPSAPKPPDDDDFFDRSTWMVTR